MIVRTRAILLTKKHLDGGPSYCSQCRTAWRPCDRCPSCGFAFAEHATQRARDVYDAQRDDHAPAPGVGDRWMQYIAAAVPSVMAP